MKTIADVDHYLQMIHYQFSDWSIQWNTGDPFPFSLFVTFHSLPLSVFTVFYIFFKAAIYFFFHTVILYISTNSLYENSLNVLYVKTVVLIVFVTRCTNFRFIRNKNHCSTLIFHTERIVFVTILYFLYVCWWFYEICSAFFDGERQKSVFSYFLLILKSYFNCPF
jgi:hypothetical protein